MKKAFGVFIGLSVVLWMASAASAGTIYTTQNLSPMSHGNYYIWNLNGINTSGQTITGATLSFSNFSDLSSSDKLYINLLSSAAVTDPSTTPITSGHYYGSDNYFDNNYTPNASLGSLTGLYQNANPSIIIPTAYYSYLTGTTFGIGFNPHCVFTDSKITLTINTSPVSTPEPATLLLLGLGLAGLAIFRMRSRRDLTTVS